MKILGAEPGWIGLADAPYRRDYYRSFRQVVFDTHPDDVEYVAQVAETVQTLCRDLAPVCLYAPLGVGTHIDHRLVHAAVGILPDRPVVVYYEDRPYALVRYAAAMRLAQLGLWREDACDAGDFEARRDEVLAESFLASFDRAHWTHTYLPPGPERETCKSRLAAWLRCGRTQRMGTCRAEIVAFDDEVFSQVIAAITAYESQFPDLFSGMGDFLAVTRDYSAQLGTGRHYAERYWSLRPSPLHGSPDRHPHRSTSPDESN